MHWEVNILTVFFFAKSPEAPRTTMTVLSLSSMELESRSTLVAAQQIKEHQI